MHYPLHIIDAFADRPFTGNPAAVCGLPEPRDGRWMQAIAAEMNLSETAFLYRSTESGAWQLRWFTPIVEVDLCGHATLAAAHFLWDTGQLAPDTAAEFQTRSGILRCTRDGDWVAMDFPAKPMTPAPATAGLIEALGVEPVATGSNQTDAFVEVADYATLVSLRPDFARLANVPVRGVIVCCQTPGADHDFASRFFAPGSGITEDPVTGSAHCCLGPYYAERLGKDDLIGYQASPRGGTVRVGVRGDRVLLGGQAVTILRGALA